MMLARSLLLTVQALLLLSVAKAFLPSVSVVHGGGRIAAVSRWDHFQCRGCVARGVAADGQPATEMIRMAAEQPRQSGRSCNRKAFFAETGRSVAAGIGLAAGVLVPQRAGAAGKGEQEEVEEPPVDWKAEFGTVRTGMKPVLTDLRTLSAEENWKEVMDKARNYDLSFRKVMMGKVRKKLPKEPKELKEEALSLSNSITFDLIAVNKAARTENKDRVLEVCDILESDINGFLKLEARL